MLRSPTFRHFALRLLRGATIVAAVSAFCYGARLGAASTALLLLIAVVLQALDSSFAESAAIAVLATASLDYFFTQPLFSFTVAGPLEGISLLCMLTVTLLITRIQARSRAQARESGLRRANMEGLYKVSRELLALPPAAAAGTALLEPILAAFDLRAVCLFDGSTLECYTAGASASDLEAKTRGGFIAGNDADYSEAGIAVRCLRARDKLSGAIGFEGLRDARVTAPALAALALGTLERTRAFHSAAQAAARAEAETTRAAILDALAHEFKTPLATILTAAGGLRAGACSLPQQTELAEMIETEASRLGDLATRLLRLARIDQEELKPRFRATDAAELIARSVRRFSRLWPGRNISFREMREAGELWADAELIGLALGQLVENACRYSPAGTPVFIELGSQDGLAAITVWNAGPPIPEGERARIFDRFFRGTEARRSAAGSGLGLYVARKIARAHGGDLALLDDRQDEVGFRLTVPFSTGEVSFAGRDL
jgi:two-component system sensor histidine kinase KdpD